MAKKPTYKQIVNNLKKYLKKEIDSNYKYAQIFKEDVDKEMHDIFVAHMGEDMIIYRYLEDIDLLKEAMQNIGIEWEED